MHDDIAAYYNLGQEAARLERGGGRLELERTQELLRRYEAAKGEAQSSRVS